MQNSGKMSLPALVGSKHDCFDLRHLVYAFLQKSIYKSIIVNYFYHTFSEKSRVFKKKLSFGLFFMDFT